VLTAKFGRWDQALFDGRHLARTALRDDFIAWGADPDALDAALQVVDDVAAAGRLAPTVARPLAAR
jgi:hypothetical protein